AAAQDLVLADHRDVVLGLAPDDAGVAADAGVDVDRHAPLVALVRVLGNERQRARRGLVAFMHDLRIALELLTRDRANHPTAFHEVVVLRARQGIAIAGLRDFEAAIEPERLGCPQRPGVESRPGPDLPATRPAVPQMD